MRSCLAAAAVVAVTLLSAGCSSAPESSVGSPSESPAVPPGVAAEDAPFTGTPGPPVLEGPASGVASWPDGLTARIAAVERVPNAWGEDVPKSEAIVRVKVDVSNGGSSVIPVEPMSSWMTLYYGINRTEGDPEVGYGYRDPKERAKKSLFSEDPTRIMPGTTVRFVDSMTVPVSELGVLAVVVELPTEMGIRDPYTFVGVEQLLKTVR